MFLFLFFNGWVCVALGLARRDVGFGFGCLCRTNVFFFVQVIHSGLDLLQ